LDSFIPYNDVSTQEKIQSHSTYFCLNFDGKTLITDRDNSNEVLWNLGFDGSFSEEGAGVGVWVSNSYTHH